MIYLNRKYTCWSRLIGGVLVLFVLGISYQLEYMSYLPVPGNDPEFPLGWWGWTDQGLYLKSSIAFSRGDFSPSQHYYMPLYPLLGALFLSYSPHHSYWLIDLILMLCFGFLFFRLISRYIGLFATGLVVIFSMTFYSQIRLQWVIPWTTTLSAFFIICMICQLDFYIRQRDNYLKLKKILLLNIFVFGLLVGATAATRTVDLVIIAPFCFVYLWYILKDVLLLADKRRFALSEGLLFIFGMLVVLAVWLTFNRVAYGTFFGGPYFSAAKSFGFFPSSLPIKIYSHLIDSSKVYVEKGQDWLSQVPIFAFAIVFIPAIFIIPSPLILRIVSISIIFQFIVYYSYSDIVPTGTFRFNNIHYFKWMMPFLLCIFIYFIKFIVINFRRFYCKICLSILVIVIVLVLVSLVDVIEQAFDVQVLEQEKYQATFLLPKNSFNLIDIRGVSDNWSAIYFAKGFIVSIDDKLLFSPRDYHAFPIEYGMRLLFVRPVQGQSLCLKLGSDVQFTKSINGFVNAKKVSLGLFGDHRNVFVISLGQMLSFTKGGGAEQYLKNGWSPGEKWGRWAVGDQAELELYLPKHLRRNLILELRAGGFVVKPLHSKTITDILVNFCTVKRLIFKNNGLDNYQLRIPSSCLNNSGALRVVFKNLTPISPRQLGVSQDSRLLGIGVASMCFRLEEENE